MTAPVNHNPVTRESGWGTTKNTPVEFDIGGYNTDEDGDPLVITTAFPAAHGTVEALGGQRLRYTPAPDYVGQDSFHE